MYESAKILSRPALVGFHNNPNNSHTGNNLFLITLEEHLTVTSVCLQEPYSEPDVRHWVLYN